MLERIQKILSARGIASRRKAEEYIERGLVKVNGKVAILGQKADPAVDKIEVDGKVIEERQEMLYYVMNKPKGVVTENVQQSPLAVGRSGQRRTANAERPKNIRDLLPANLQGKIYPVGRLDKDSEGLLLLTNDGVLAYRLTHPKFDHEKEYDVTVDQDIMDGQLLKLREGVKIFGEKTKPTRVLRTGPNRFRITLTEGRNRQIRRMCQKVGVQVVQLKRIRIMTLQDERLREGQIRELTKDEVVELLKAVGLGISAVVY